MSIRAWESGLPSTEPPKRTGEFVVEGAFEASVLDKSKSMWTSVDAELAMVVLKSIRDGRTYSVVIEETRKNWNPPAKENFLTPLTIVRKKATIRLLDLELAQIGEWVDIRPSLMGGVTFPECQEWHVTIGGEARIFTKIDETTLVRTK